MTAGRPGDNKALRVQIDKTIEQSTAGLPAETREAVRDFVSKMLPDLIGEINSRVKKGEHKKLSLTALLKEVRGILNAVKGPATTITQIVTPSSGQGDSPNKREAIRLMKSKGGTFEAMADAEEEN